MCIEDDTDQHLLINDKKSSDLYDTIYDEKNLLDDKKNSDHQNTA